MPVKDRMYALLEERAMRGSYDPAEELDKFRKWVRGIYDLEYSYGKDRPPGNLKTNEREFFPFVRSWAKKIEKRLKNEAGITEHYSLDEGASHAQQMKWRRQGVNQWKKVFYKKFISGPDGLDSAKWATRNEKKAFKSHIDKFAKKMLKVFSDAEKKAEPKRTSARDLIRGIRQADKERRDLGID